MSHQAGMGSNEKYFVTDGFVKEVSVETKRYLEFLRQLRSKVYHTPMIVDTEGRVIFRGDV